MKTVQQLLDTTRGAPHRLNAKRNKGLACIEAISNEMLDGGDWRTARDITPIPPMQTISGIGLRGRFRAECRSREYRVIFVVSD